jgi:hypothetical protein
MDKTGKWIKPGDSGRMMIIHLEKLKIDNRYQRTEVSQTNTLRIAKNFSWEAFGVPIIMERTNGDFYVVDGQQRILAAKLRGDIKEARVLVFKSAGIEHESAAFRTMAIERKPITSFHKFKSGVIARHEPELSINKFLLENNFAVVDNSHTINGINFPGVLVQSWRVNNLHMRTALLLQRQILGVDRPMSALIHKAIFYLICNGIDVGKYSHKIIMQGGEAAITKEVKSVAIETGKTISLRVAGIGLLRVINYKLKKKIYLPEVNEIDEVEGRFMANWEK